jgi:ankyrin repeat protein
MSLLTPERGRLGEGSIMSSLEADSTSEVTQWVLDSNTHIDDTEPGKQQTALILCARHGSSRCLQLLIQAGANLNATMKAGATALYLATQMGQTRCVQLLLHAGAHTDIPATTGATALHVSAQKGLKDVMSLLIKAGANVNAAWKNNGTTVSWVGYTILDLLLSSSLSLSLLHDFRCCCFPMRTQALFIAAQHNHQECVRALVAAGSNTNATLNEGVSIILRLAKLGEVKMLRLLLTLAPETNVNATMKDGTTPMLLVSQEGSSAHYECMQILIEHGANVRQARGDGATPLDLAKQMGNTK